MNYGIPNKFEIFQDYYYATNGVMVSYAEALRLFSQMDADTKSEFEQYYKDETGYEILTPNGYNLSIPIIDIDPTGKKTVKKKVKQDDGTIKRVDKEIDDYSLNRSKYTQGYLDIKYTLEAYAAENGIILDPLWTQFSAEEIVRMEDDGVVIPQEVLDAAHAVYDSQAAADALSDNDDTEDPVEKEPFLNLIPNAVKKIGECEENNQKIVDEINEILPEKNEMEKELSDKMEEQAEAFRSYESNLREWTKLNDKMNNGEALTEAETKRYEELSKIIDSKKSEDNSVEFDKSKIASSINELNILAVLGEKLADETIEIADNLADYTSKTNYKSTYNETIGQVGPFVALAMMFQGKTLAKEAGKVGNDTRAFSEETKQTVSDIAEIADIELTAVDTENTEEPQAETEEEETTQNNEEKDEKERFVVTDASVLKLIDEANTINADTKVRIKNNKSFIAQAKKDMKFVKSTEKMIDEVVEEFEVEEERRQQEIQEKEEENAEAKEKISNLTGQSEEEIDKEISGKQNKNNENLDDSTREEVEKYKKIIVDNNQDITEINQQSDNARADVKSTVSKEKGYINNAVPAEVEAIEAVAELQEEELPEHNERMDFIRNAGATLAYMGTEEILIGGRFIEFGVSLLPIPFYNSLGIFYIGLGSAFVAKGTVSLGIGTRAVDVADDRSLLEKAEETGETASISAPVALNALTTLDEKIISVTEEDAALGANTVEETGATEDTTEGSTENPTEEGSVSGEESPVNTESVMVDTNVEASVDDITAQPNELMTTGQNSPVEPNDAEQVEDTNIETNNLDNSDNKVQKEKTEKNEQEQAEDVAADAQAQKKQLTKQSDTQEKIIKNTDKSGKDDAKESKNIEKDQQKTAKQLEKEAKQLEKSMKKDQKEVEKLTKESAEAAKKQAESLAEYEALVAESEMLIAEDEQKNMQSQPQQGAAATNAFSIGGGQGNADRIQQNSARIDELGVEFNMHNNIITRNRAKITQIQNSVKTKETKYNKKVKIITKKTKETEKKEKDKQKRLAKQLAAVGIAENVFGILSATGTLLDVLGVNLDSTGKVLVATGTPMLSNPFTAIAGAVLVAMGNVCIFLGTSTKVCGNVLKLIGTAGTIACGVTKGIINIANGNLTAGLIAIGTTAVTAAMSMTGTGSAASGVLQGVSAGLQIVSSSTELVNNVRAVQGKEASGVMSKISAVAGVTSAVTGAASSFTNGGFSQADTFGKITKVASATGTALSSTSQLMTTFGNDSKAAQILGMVGGGLQTVSSLAQITQKFGGAKSKNEDNKNKAEQVQENSESKEEATQTEAQEKTDKQEKVEKQDDKPEQNADGAIVVTQNTNPVELAQQPVVQQTIDNEVQQVAASVAQNNSTVSNLDAQNQQIQQQAQNLNDENGIQVNIDTTAGAPTQAEVEATLKANIQKMEENAKTDLAAKIAAKEAKQQLMNEVFNTLGSAVQTAVPLLASQSAQANSNNRRPVPVGKLTDRVRKIIQKNQRRIQALTVMHSAKSQKRYA